MGCAASKVSDQQQNDDNDDDAGGNGDDVPIPAVSIEGDATVEVIPVPEGEKSFLAPLVLSLYSSTYY